MRAGTLLLSPSSYRHGYVLTEHRDSEEMTPRETGTESWTGRRHFPGAQSGGRVCGHSERLVDSPGTASGLQSVCLSVSVCECEWVCVCV